VSVLWKAEFDFFEAMDKIKANVAKVGFSAGLGKVKLQRCWFSTKRARTNDNKILSDFLV
jgi:hypothetical protein